jgi:hypothetical protein
MRRLALVLTVAAAAMGGVAAAVALADGTPLHGSVGPGFAISLKDGSGATVSHLDPGAYALTVDDLSDMHNFHLTGPGVDVGTTVEGTGEQTFALTLVDGTYSFICNAHPLSMKGSFTVGTAAPPPPTTPPPTTPEPMPPAPSTRINVGVADHVLTLRNAGGSAVRRLRAGSYVFKVSDRSKTQNVHVVGAGVNRRTGIGFTGTVTWRMNLKKGTLVYRSDARPAGFRAVTVTVTP